MQAVFRREYFDGLYPLFAAFMAEMTAELPFIIFMPALMGRFLRLYQK